MTKKLSARRKFTPTDIAIIRSAPCASRKLARKLGVSFQTLWKARTGLTYKDLPSYGAY